jgi:hypothetical protein
MSWHGGVRSAPSPAAASCAAVPCGSGAGYIVWRVGPTWYARSNVHGTRDAADAAGVPWAVVAWSPADLLTALGAQEVIRGTPG